MADVLKAEGMVLAVTRTSSGTVYPFACAKNSTITISRDIIELAPKTNAFSKEYTLGRSSFTISGSGLIKLEQSYMQPWFFMEELGILFPNKFRCYLDMIDNQNNYKSYKFDCFFTELTAESTYGSTPSYSYTLQGTGPIELTNIIDTQTVSSGKITGLSTVTYKLVGLGYGGKWYFNYSVTNPSAGVYEIIMTGVPNGTVVKAAYIPI